MTERIVSCRGNEKKVQICRDYDVRVISRMALLPGQIIEGCCGDLENEHTIFAYKHRKSGYEDTFSVGKECAEKFLNILGQKLPTLVDPLQNIQIPGAHIIDGSPTQGVNLQADPLGSSGRVMPMINAELYVAINLWCILRKQIPKFALQRILASIQTNPYAPLQEKDVYDFLKVLASYKKSLSHMLSEAQRVHQSIKNYSFPILNSIASNNLIDLP